MTNTIRDFGTVTFTIGADQYSTRGEITINNIAGGTREFSANMDRTMHSQFTPSPVTVEIGSISAASISISELVERIRSCDAMNATVAMSGLCAKEPLVAVLPNAQIGGEISLNANTGEISGITVSAPTIRFTEE